MTPPPPAKPVSVHDLRPSHVVGRHGHPGERLILIGINPPAMIRRGSELVERHLLSVAYDDGIGFVIPLFADETILRHVDGAPITRSPKADSRRNGYQLGVS